MTSVSQVEQSLKHILEERATVLARETGCIQRQRKFSGADLLQTLVFGWLTHPEMSLEMLASTAATRQVQVTDTAVHKRFSKPCAQFLHAVLEEVTSVIVEADREVPVELLRRFEAVVLEESSSIALPEELAEQWQGCGGAPGEGQAAVKLHVRWVSSFQRFWHIQLSFPRNPDLLFLGMKSEVFKSVIGNTCCHSLYSQTRSHTSATLTRGRPIAPDFMAIWR